MAYSSTLLFLPNFLFCFLYCSLCTNFCSIHTYIQAVLCIPITSVSFPWSGNVWFLWKVSCVVSCTFWGRHTECFLEVDTGERLFVKASTWKDASWRILHKWRAHIVFPYIELLSSICWDSMERNAPKIFQWCSSGVLPLLRTQLIVRVMSIDTDSQGILVR